MADPLTPTPSSRSRNDLEYNKFRADTNSGFSVSVVNPDGSNISGGGGGGGTSSNFGSANPTTGTAAGFSDGTNMQEARVFDTDSGAGVENTLGVVLRKSASGGSVELGTNTNPVRTDPTGTTTQPSSITDGTNTANNLKSDGTAAGQNALLTGGSYLSVPFTTTTAQAVGSTDAGNYRWVSVHVVAQGTSSTITFQSSNDNTNWVSTALAFSSSVASTPVSSTTSASVIYSGPLTGRYFRLNVTGISAGTTSGVIVFSTFPSSEPAFGGQVAQTGTWTVGSNSATGSAVPANAFYVGGINSSGNLAGIVTYDRANDGASGTGIMSVGNYLYNGTNDDRIRSVINGTNSTGTGIVASGMIAQLDDTSPTTITENQFGNLRIDSARQLRVNSQLAPDATALNTYSVHLTTNTTTTPTAATAYISSITIAVQSAGTTSTVTVQDKSGTPLKLVSGFSTASLLSNGNDIYNFQTPVKMVGGIDIVTAGAAAATIDVWINYYQ